MEAKDKKDTKTRSKWLKHSKLVYSVIILICIGIIVTDLIYIGRKDVDRHRHQVFISKIKGLATNPSYKPTATTKEPNNYLTDYQVSARDPKLIIIPKINVDTRVVSTGLNNQNQIGTPPNSIETAWYRYSSLPGNPGVTFIDGHVDGLYVPGVFYNLKDLVSGDKIEIVTGDNTTYTYIVQKIQTYSATSVNMAQVLSPINPNVSGLNLMTCTGGLIDNDTNFNERLVVFSSLQA
jgi:sortase (surface protein transpeptidase)